MESLSSILHRLVPAHRNALQWFLDRQGQEVSWPKPLGDGTYIVNKAKGIHKPAGIAYAVSVRQSLNGPYADRDPIFHEDGSWSYKYFQEQLDPKERDSQFTNVALLACKSDGIPVGVMRQVKAKPNPRYQVLGLAFVDKWDNGYFQFESVRASQVADVQTVQQLESTSRSATAGSSLSFEDERRWIDATIVLREGQGAFRELVLKAYRNRCAISDCAVEQVLQAAHIHRYFGQQTNIVQNGLLLRADIHTLYDRALIAIEPATFEVIVSPKLRQSAYGKLAGCKIALPANLEDWPDRAALLEHKRWVLSQWDKDKNGS